MAADSLGQRIVTQARAVRTRIAAWAILLTGLALLGSGLAAYVVESDRIEQRIVEALRQELAEFEQLRSTGIDPQTGQRFTSAARLMEVALMRNVPDHHETIVVFREGEPALVSAVEPRYKGLTKDEAFLQAVRELTPQGGSRRLDTSLGPVVMAVQPVRDPDSQGAFVPVYFPDGEREDFEAVMRTYAVVATGAMLLASAGAWLVAGRLLQPLRHMRATAQEISDTDLSRRLDTTGNDDITDLGETINAMLDRLELSFVQQRRFLDDAGHELRTPITIVRGHLELLDPSQHDDTVTTRDLVLDEVDRMSRLVDDMVVLARAGQPDFLQPTDVDAGMLTDEILDKARALGERTWKLDDRAEGTVRVDPQRVTQAMVQLTKNAVQHTRLGDVIAFGSSVQHGTVCWWVRDSGPGVLRADAERIFERFQRGHHARGAEGSGLGLSIVRAIAAAHGGEVTLQSTPGEGATFTLQVPPGARPEPTEVP